MEIFLKIIFFEVLIFSLLGCGNDFLEETLTKTISIEDVTRTGVIYPEILDATLRGIYETMYQDGTGVTISYVDFG